MPDPVSASLEPRTDFVEDYITKYRADHAAVDAWTDLLREFPTHRDTKIRALIEKHRPAIEEQAATEARRELLAKLRSPRNSLGKLALPKGLMERAVEAAWDGATSPVGDPADGIEMHNLADLADGIVDHLARLIEESDRD